MAIHIVLQGKGGVGKSVVASHIAQYLKDKTGVMPFCIDTDPVNDTFSRYAAFGTKRYRILDSTRNVDQRAFDGMIEDIINHPGDVVIDNGAATFLPLSSYMNENKIVELLQGAGKEVFIHTVLTGGQAFEDTLVGLNELVEKAKAPIVVWENEYFGIVEKNGKKFDDSAIYQKNKDKFAGKIILQDRTSDTFGKDMEIMLSNKMTYDEAMNSELFSMVPRQRLKIIQKAVYDQLAEAI